MNRRRTRNKRMKTKKNNYSVVSLIGIVVVLLILTIFATDTKTSKGNNNFITTEEKNNTIVGNQEEEQTNDSNDTENSVNSDLKVYFIDVGQADSILILNNNESMLIDAGNNEDGDDVVNFIKDKGIKKLNYVVGTHPHEDHIGGLDDVIDNFEIENIYMPKIDTTTKTFEDVLNSVANKNLTITSPKKGETFTIGEARL